MPNEKLITVAVPQTTPLMDALEIAAPKTMPKALSTTDLFWAALDAPIYESLILHEDANLQIFRLRKLDGQYDRYCPVCKQQTPWTPKISTSTSTSSMYLNWLGKFVLSNQCKRCSVHHSVHLNAIESETTGAARLVKFGEWPSLSEFHRSDLIPYLDVTTPEQRADFTRAIQSAASGFSSGACVYLRRVLESIIGEARSDYATAHGSPSWEKEFDEARTNKRMTMLKDYLPAFLVENKRIYNLLSQGVHSLSDAECGDLFPRLREAIELIFQGRHEVLARQRRERAIAKFIAQSDNPQK